MAEAADTNYYRDGHRLLRWNGRAWVDNDTGKQAVLVWVQSHKNWSLKTG
ncbi:MAG: hypothetical protein WCI74_11015 [Actinomycetes bacterium]